MRISHKIYWWWIKVFLGIGLIAGVVGQFALGYPLARFEFPISLAQALVIVGVALYVWSFLLVKRANPSMRSVQTLVTNRGMFQLVRHPMYFADLLYYLGLALLWPSATSAFMYIAAAVALILQSNTEDRWCSDAFPDLHQRWSKKSKLLIPYVF